MIQRVFASALPFVLAAAPLDAQKPRDLTKLDACKVLTTADVEAAAKGKQQTPQVGGGAGGVHCGYFLQLPDKSVEQYDFYLEQEKLTVEVWKAFPEQKGTPVPGLWDEAYIAPAGGGTVGQLRLTALHRGDMSIEVQGPRRDVIIALARVAIGRLK
jgi:hypothetical protein